MTSRMGVSEARGCRGTLVLNGPGLEAYKDSSSVCLKQSMRWAFKELCGIDTQDQVMDQMKNIHFKFKKTCLLCDFDYFGPKSLPYKPLGQRCGFLLKKHQFWIGMFLTPALEEIAFMCC